MNRCHAKASACRWMLVGITLVFCQGCQTSRPSKRVAVAEETPRQVSVSKPVPFAESRQVQLVSHQASDKTTDVLPTPTEVPPESIATPELTRPETLEDLEAQVRANNPTLRRMQHEAAAMWAKSNYVAKLPDPSLGTNFFIPPMNFDPDRQVGEVQVMQMIPALARLRAEARQACMEALAAENLYRAERLRIIGDLRTAWYRLYVLEKQVETTEADKSQLETLIRTANARVATGDAQPGDVLMVTLERSSIEEQLLSYRQQVAATCAELNRLAGRDSDVPVTPPSEIHVSLPEWNLEFLRHVATNSQPELIAARLRTAATRWGIEVAQLKRRPDLTFGAGWVIMDAPGSTMPDAGADNAMVSVGTTLPIWHSKYNAIAAEASRQHYAAHASEDEIALRLDATLRDLWEQTRTSHQTVALYESSILPQARQTLDADQQSLVNNTVTFDRVVRDYRTLLSLELGYHKALGQFATALARIRQTVGIDLASELEITHP